MDKLSELPVRIYATGHGPLVRYGLLNSPKLTGNSQQQTTQDTTVALLYASAYGYGNFGASDRSWHHQSWGRCGID